MNIRVNGQAMNLEDMITLEELLELLGRGENPVAVARNMTFVPRGSYASTRIWDGDEIEIVEPRQGG